MLFLWTATDCDLRNNTIFFESESNLQLLEIASQSPNNNLPKCRHGLLTFFHKATVVYNRWKLYH